MPTDQDYRYLAEDSYNIDSKLLKQTLQEGQIVGNGRYIIVDKPVDNTRNGMQAMAVAPILEGTKDRPDLSHIIIAFAGTNSSDFLDLQTDLQMIGAGATETLTDVKTRTLQDSQGKTALEYARQIAAKYPKVAISTTGHSLGQSQAMYVALKNGWLNVGYNGPDIHHMLTQDGIKYMMDHPEQFRNYRNKYDLIGNITGNKTQTAIYYNGIEGLYGPLKVHSLNNWKFDQDGNVIDSNGKRLTPKLTIALAQTTVETFRITQLKKRLAQDGLSENETIFLDAEEAFSISRGLVSTAETALAEMTTSVNASMQKAEELFRTTKSMPKGVTDLTEAELSEAYAAGGVTYDSIVAKTSEHFEAKIAQAQAIVTAYNTLKNQIDTGIDRMLAQDSVLAGDFKKWKA
ncbi:alpha/beta hydrolase family protein [Streptococcus iniae]|uniref:hypothetical protein n=1 Tax=Streptococcus iniae TaxID=1346 RepID=UPI002B28B93B|nr:hypothetical protein QYR57_01580 [Streptococcus iniae]